MAIVHETKVGDFVVYCDEHDCNFSHEFDDQEYGFLEVIEQVRQLGWESYKIDEEWHHRCPSCKKKVQSKMGKGFPR